ncbi:hypothetical protein OQA88_11491 [Cercophora sp. LCS_1]
MPLPKGPPPTVADDPMPPQSRAAGVSAHTLLGFFSRAITSFQRSETAFQVVCTLPRSSISNAPGSSPSAKDGAPELPGPVPPRKKPSALIVLDSSFNPPTRAHLRMAASAVEDHIRVHKRTADGLRVLLLLAVNNADKASKPAAFDQRLAMMWAFAKDVQESVRGEKIQNSESQREPVVDIALTTLPYFSAKSAAIAEAEFFKQAGGQDMEQVMLVGYDTLIRILDPKYYGTAAPEEGEKTPMQKALNPFFARTKLRVTMRTDDEWGSRAEQQAYLDDLLLSEGMDRIGGDKAWASRIELVEGRKAGEDIVSSTYARDAAAHQNWSRLARMVTSEVGNWIEREKLYAP